MANVVIDKKEELVMKLIHYFVTEENYRPIIVHGVQNEVWLENLDNNIPIIRININYIHNNEQFNTDTRKVDMIRKNIKKKTFSFNMNVLNILINTRDDVDVISDKAIECVKINKIRDLKKNNFINEYFPSFKDKVNDKTSDINNIITMTEELNEKTTKEDKKLAKIFANNDKPIITAVLIAINVLVFIYTFFNYSFVINNFASYYELVKAGEFYRLVSAAFVHANIYHIFFNMYALYAIGIQAEKYYGKLKYILIYLGSAIMGCLFSCTLTNNVSVGASGAIFGLFGAMLYFGYKYRTSLDAFLRSGIIPVILINLVLGFVIPNVDVAGHIGGLIGGILLSFALGVEGKSEKKNTINGTIIFLILSGVMVYLLLNK